MSEHAQLGVLIVVSMVAVFAVLTYMAWMLRAIQESARDTAQALRAGQEHIVELVAEVLRRTRP